MCVCVCVFITCYNLHYRSRIKQSPPQQNPVYNMKPRENSLQLWPLQKDPYPHPSHFCWLSFQLMKTRCRQTCPCKVVPSSPQVAGRTGLHWCSPLPCVQCQPASVVPSCAHAGCCLGLEDPPVIYCGAPGDWQLATVGHLARRNLAHSSNTCSHALAHSVYKPPPKQCSSLTRRLKQAGFLPLLCRCILVT